MPRKASAPPVAPPSRPSYATAATSGPAPPPAQWEIIGPKKQKNSPADCLFTPGFTKVNRELIIKLSTSITDSLDTMLATANKAVTGTPFRFWLARISPRDNIILTIIRSVSASEAEKYKTALAAAILSLGPRPTNIPVNSRWTKFIIYIIPTSGSYGIPVGQTVASAIHSL